MDLFQSEAGGAARTGEIDIVTARWVGHRRGDWRSLFAGFRTLRCITFSAGVEMILDLAALFEDVEIIFGSERIISRNYAVLVNITGAAESYGLKDALVDQKSLTEALASQLDKAHARLLPRVLDGSLRFRLLRADPSHEKLYLLEGGNGHTRVITGSANLSRLALRGGQREIITAFDDDAAAFAYYAQSYERDSADAALIEVDQIAKARAGEIELGDTPLARRIAGGMTLIEDAADARGAAPIWSREALRRAESEGRKLAAVDLPRNKRGQAVINAGELRKVIAQFRNRPLVAEEADAAPRVAVDLDAGEVDIGGRPLVGAGAAAPETAHVARDARLLIDYFDGFASDFRGDIEGALNAYWALLNWMYASPFVSFLRRAAILNNRTVYMYPAAAVVYGKSGAGKSQFVKTVLLSMYGVAKPLAADDFTRTLHRGLRATMGAFPIVVDDIQQRRFTEQAVSIIKDDFFSEAPAPVIVFSANQDLRSIDTEIAKRSVICHLDVSVPQKAMFANNRVRRVQEAIGTDLYRRYLALMMPEARSLRAALHGDDAASAQPDLLARSSAVLVACLAEALGAPPSWARPLAIEQYVDVSQRRIQQKLMDMWRANREMFDIDQRRNEVVITAASPLEARYLERDLHDTIIKQMAGQKIILDLRELEGFLGIRLKRGWFDRLRR